MTKNAIESKPKHPHREHRFRDLTREQLVQASGGEAGPSDSNRVIERHELPGNQGG